MTATERAPRVLVVDDEISILTFAQRALSDAGYDVVVASDGPDALRTLETQRPFHVFVVDVRLPQMRGDELGRQLRQRTPIVKPALRRVGRSSRSGRLAPRSQAGEHHG